MTVSSSTLLEEAHGWVRRLSHSEITDPDQTFEEHICAYRRIEEVRQNALTGDDRETLSPTLREWKDRLVQLAPQCRGFYAWTPTEPFTTPSTPTKPGAKIPRSLSYVNAAICNARLSRPVDIPRNQSSADSLLGKSFYESIRK